MKSANRRDGGRGASDSASAAAACFFAFPAEEPTPEVPPCLQQAAQARGQFLTRSPEPIGHGHDQHGVKQPFQERPQKPQPGQGWAGRRSDGGRGRRCGPAAARRLGRLLTAAWGFAASPLLDRPPPETVCLAARRICPWWRPLGSDLCLALVAAVILAGIFLAGVLSAVACRPPTSHCLASRPA